MRPRAESAQTRGSTLVDASWASGGCQRADPDVRPAARMTMPAWGRVTNRCLVPLSTPRPNQSYHFNRRPAVPPELGRRPCERGPRASIREARGPPVLAEVGAKATRLRLSARERGIPTYPPLPELALRAS